MQTKKVISVTQKKSKYNPEQLWDSIAVTSEIACTKCKKISSVYGLDDFESCDKFFEDGWRATSSNIYCPNCSKQYLKKA